MMPARSGNSFITCHKSIKLIMKFTLIMLGCEMFLKKKRPERVQNFLTLVTLIVFENTSKVNYVRKLLSHSTSFINIFMILNSLKGLLCMSATIRSIPCLRAKASFKMKKPRFCPWVSSYPGLCQAFKSSSRKALTGPGVKG